MSRFIDITPAVSAATPVFPGDTPFAAQSVMAISKDVPVNVSRLTLSSHAGAHADAPLHYDAGGAPIDAVDVGAYIGPCTVVHIINDAALLNRDMVRDALAQTGANIAPRVLIRTYARQPQVWDPAFTAISAEAVAWLAGEGVRLIGVDTPSLDPASSKIMDAHRAVFAHDMRILEGLCLDAAPEGAYELIAPPLKLEGLDAAPVRAVLRVLE
ncbi:MAG: arylformamidase [Alphaproteobacteria bacterium]|nr:arylformamidase [Alphaproteobacteria bacterium]